MSNNLNYSPIAISVGEPAGIGPDIVLKNLIKLDLSKELIKNSKKLKIFADKNLLKQRAELLNLDFNLINNLEAENLLSWEDIKIKTPVKPGVLDPENSTYVLACLKQAALFCQENQKNKVSLVTGPIHKGVINQAGFKFTGHTEFLRDLAGLDLVVMMMVCPKLNLKIALATTHIALSQVPQELNSELLEKIIKILDLGLKKYFNQNHLLNFPKIALCGLNPHAGEEGYLGLEEKTWIEPLVKKFKKINQINISGPYSGDSIFNIKNREKFDVILALYHDQGLAPFKALCFGEGVNVTLGLPYLRTSVDHGTALDLAGTGKAGAESFWEALSLVF